VIAVDEFCLELLEHHDALKVTEDVVLDLFSEPRKADCPTRTGHSRLAYVPQEAEHKRRPPNVVWTCVITAGENPPYGYQADVQVLRGE
jgi:hypothetical protein